MMSYTLLPFRPKLTLSEWRIFKEFLGWMSLSQIVMAINWQSEQFILGRLMPPARFGQFSTANNLTNIPMTIMFVPVLRPLLSAFALVKHDTPRLARSYRNAASAVVVVGLPILIGEAILAAPEVRLLLGQKWLGAIPMLHWLAISLMPGLFAIPFTPLGMALNQTRQLTFRNLVQLCVKLPLVIGGALTYGFAGVIGARIISEVFTTFYCMHVAKKILGIPIIGQFVDCWRAFVAALAMFDAIKLSEPYFAGGPGLFNLSLQLLALVAIGAVTYIGSLLIFWLASGKPEGIESTATRLLLGILGRKSAARIPVEAAGTEPN
jgi:PST family polysaccharide transporter